MRCRNSLSICLTCVQHWHAAKRLLNNLKWTHGCSLPCYCYAIEISARTFRNMPMQTRVANLAFFKPDFEILAFLNTFGFFGKLKKIQTKSGFFWLFFRSKGLDLEKHCLSCIFITNLLWKESITMQDAQNIERILLFPWRWSILLLRKKHTTVELRGSECF